MYAIAKAEAGQYNNTLAILWAQLKCFVNHSACAALYKAWSCKALFSIGSNPHCLIGQFLFV